MKKRVHFNSLFFKIACTVVIGILLLAAAEGMVNIMVSRTVFVKTFSESQEKIFNQIDEEFYGFFKDMSLFMSDLCENETVEEYLKNEELSGVEAMRQAYSMEQQVDRHMLDEYYQVSLFVICKNRNSYIYSKSDVFSAGKDEILASGAAAEAFESPGAFICRYEDHGFTAVTRSEPVVILAKAWASEEGKPADMLVMLTIKESDLRRMYSHFTVSTSDIIVLNRENEVISSDNPAYFKSGSAEKKNLDRAVEKMTEEEVFQTEMAENGEQKTYLMQRLQGTDHKLVGTIDFDAAFWSEYRFTDVIVLTAVILLLIMLAVFFFIREQTNPLAKLAMTMKNSREQEFKEHVPVEGTDEARELSETYNQMVDEIGTYIDRLIRTEQEKRKAEIHALQMQINPHYIYNTLASIKWLIWQGEADKSTAMIDAFISLLRNTISNTDEFVTVEQEIENLKNYAFINQTRYGDAVSVEYYTQPQCMQYKVPKLILQPFVENAFFHAFPQGQRGRIQVFVKEEGDNLRFDIVDDGAGIGSEQLRALVRGERPKSEHFTGIGIGNVDERIKTIYGMDYGINIFSEEGKGTRVILLLRREPESGTAAASAKR